MTATIAQLQSILETTESNGNLFRGIGDEPRADELAAFAAELRQAIAILTAVAKGPIWPEPVTS